MNRFPAIIPNPSLVTQTRGDFILRDGGRMYSSALITFLPATPAMEQSARYLADVLQADCGLSLVVQPGHHQSPGIHLHQVSDLPEFRTTFGAEGYDLRVAPEGIVLRALEQAGIFYAIQTLRQVCRPFEDQTLGQGGEIGDHPGSIVIPGCVIQDAPRYPWRGMMLDVARHFFPPVEIERLIDLLAAYKINRLHLHLSDDQGWRIKIHSWPRLAEVGGSSAVGGGPGGYFTQQEFRDLAEYAARRQITLIPEIEMPGHTHAALASYPNLNPDGQERPRYHGTEVGFSSLDAGLEITYRFIEEVVGEVAALTPGKYFHIGGDESHSTSLEDYRRMLARFQEIVARQGKKVIGWEEIAKAELHPETIVQIWNGTAAAEAFQQGAPLIISPGYRVYLDMKYTPETPIGLEWAGYIEVRDAYDWDPETALAADEYIRGVPADKILGVEAPLWTETIQTRADLDYMVFPRLLGIAEVAWSLPGRREWDGYRQRLAAHGRWLESQGVNFYRSPQVAWD